MESEVSGKVFTVFTNKKQKNGCVEYALYMIIAVVVIAIIGSLADNRPSSSTESSYPTNQPSYTPATATPFGNLTMGQRNALSAAESYLAFTAFSRQGLIEQLEYDGFSNSDAVYAADHCGANWNEQAAQSAESYLDMMSFSRQELIEQLEYEGFTHSQSVYGAEAVGY